MNRFRRVLFCLMLAVLLAPAFRDVRAQQTQIELVPVLSGLDSPVFVTNAHDTSERVFIVEQPGRIKVLQANAQEPSVFLDIVTKVLSGGERGLLGLAFHPQFRDNKRFFVNYTRRPDGATVIAEYRVSAANPNVADATEHVLITITQPFANHNGGMIAFGPDSLLYIGMGDGGSANDPLENAQDVQELLGKILRIDVDQTNGSIPYSSPPDNPFFGPTPGRDEIYAVGLRNPWRFSFDRVNGQLFVGDVGQGAREEVSIVTRGGNYGWRVFEGTLCTNLGPIPCSAGSFIPPIAEYGHTGGRCSITGGYVYRGAKSTLPMGSYVFGDFCTGEIFLLEGGAQRLLIDTSISVSSFGEDEAGEIYVVGLGGTVHRITGPELPPPPAEFRIDSFLIRKRWTGVLFDPITARPNGKKFDLVVSGVGFQDGAIILIDGAPIKKTLRGDPPDKELIGKLRNTTLLLPGMLRLEVQSPNGTLSNALFLQVLP